MPLSSDEREAFLALLPDLGPGQNRDSVTRFLRDHWTAALDELGALPGYDQVRAGLIRAMEPMLEGDARTEAYEQATAALEAYRSRADDNPLVLLARHPAWVGLAALELANWDDTPNRARAMSRALSLTASGFNAIDDGQAAGRGEVLWAMAEQADEAGWTAISAELLEAASEAPFTAPESQAQVKLLLGLRWVEDSDPRGALLLTEVSENGHAPDRTRVHALWVLAAVRSRAGNTAEATRLLELALEQVDSESEPEIATRIASAIGEFE